MIEDDALARLYRRLEDALWQIDLNAPTIQWRNTHDE